MADAAPPLNLLRDAWLPVKRRSGTVEQISPARLTEGIADDPVVASAWPRPDFNGAAQEFVIGLLATTVAPQDDREWLRWWDSPPSPSELATRFSHVEHAFNLDGPGPRFMQDLNSLHGASEKRIASLLIDAPGTETLRNNADLFVKRDGVAVLSRAAAAMALFTLNAYAPSGGAGHRTSLRGGGPMTTLVVVDHPTLGDTLWGRLWSNVETAALIRRRGEKGQVFPWLEPTRTSSPKAKGRPTTPSDVHPLQVYWSMPRRIRLDFQPAEGARCSLMDTADPVVVPAYLTRNYGTNYSEGFEHPLTPHYRQKAGSARLPLHPNPGGISYRLWPGLVVQSKDGLRTPAPMVRHWQGQRGERLDPCPEVRLRAFGYDMVNMKARAWVESEMPLWEFGDEATLVECEEFVGRAVSAAATVARSLIGSVKAALYDRPKDAPGDYGFVGERLFRHTEPAFHAAVREAARSVADRPDDEDPSLPVRETWMASLTQAALALFDEFATIEGIEDRDMRRYVSARFSLNMTLRGKRQERPRTLRRYQGRCAGSPAQASNRGLKRR